MTTTRRGQEIAYALADSHVQHIALDAITHAQEDRPEAETGEPQ